MLERIGTFGEKVLSVIITLLIASMFVAMYLVGKPIHEAAVERVQLQARLAHEAQFSPYNGQIVSGSKLVTAVTRYSMVDEFYVYVNNGVPGGLAYIATSPFASGVCYLMVVGGGISNTLSPPGTCTHPVSVITNEAEPARYVLPHARYRSEIVRDRNNRIAGIYFEKL